VTTFAGLMGSCGYADGTGSAARFSYPNNIASDSAGNLYTTEYSDTIRRITPSGVVTTLAGLANSAAFADGTGSGARFNHPSGIIVDSAGYIYVGDTGNYRIRKITPDGVVTTIAGALVGYVDGTGNAAKFNYLQGIAVDSVGNLYAADSVNNAIRKIDPSGVVTTFAGGTSGSTDGIGTAAAFNRPSGISIDSSGNLYVADTNNTIRKITPGAVVTTIAGLALTGGSTDAIGSAARFNRPKGVIISPAGVAYVADTNNNTIRKISR
jgi:sugar lactone lactonase YvrE